MTGKKPEPIVKVGDKVNYLSGVRYVGDMYDVPVTAVARKYATVEIGPGRTIQFDKFTGKQRSEGAYLGQGRIETPAMTAERTACCDAYKRIVEHGWSYRLGMHGVIASARHSAETLNAIADLLDQENRTDDD